MKGRFYKMSEENNSYKPHYNYATHYFNETNLNIIPKKDFMKLTQEVFHLISENLSNSLGPLGSSATILDGMLTEATKDGYTILSKYTFNNRYKKMIYNLIKAPCTRMNNTVGDGTTTAITLTDAILDNYIAQKDNIDSLYRLPRDFTAAWDEVIAEIINRVNGMAVQVDPEDYDTIHDIAYVVSNGNEEVSSAVAKVYHDSKSPAIKMKDSPTNKSYLEVVGGFEFPANAIDTVFVKNQDLSVTEKNVATIIFDHVVDTDTFMRVILPLKEVYHSRGQKLIVIAAQYDDMMLDTTVKKYVNIDYQKYNGDVAFSLLQFANGKLSKHQLADLAIVLNSIVITQQLLSVIKENLNPDNPDPFVEEVMDPESQFYRMIGYAAEALITCENGSIFQPAENIKDNKYYQDAITIATKELNDIIAKTDYEKQSFAAKIYDARARLLQLNMKNYIYYVGADSDLQKQILHDSIEDVIKCLRSAVKYGVVPGCQISIVRAARDYINELDSANSKVINTDLKRVIASLIIDSCYDVYKKVLNGPDGDGIKKAYKLTDKEADTRTKRIIDRSIADNEVFDISTLKYNPSIITSVETDTMVLSAASELIKILISGNQCVFIDSDVTESHQDTIDAYV